VTTRSMLRRLIVYEPPDHVAFWRARASEPGWCSVMWRNPVYNACAHEDQWATIRRYLPPRRAAVLDLGCGTGRLSVPLAVLFDRYVGVDLDLMIAEARRRNTGLDIDFVADTIQTYAYPPERFDLVLSMACLGNACPRADLQSVAAGMVRTAVPGGRIVLIDAFHRVPALARTCRVTPREVVELFVNLGVSLVEWSGLHCVPLRLCLARPALARYPRLTRLGYCLGERVLRAAPRRLGDYSVLVFAKPPCTSD